MVSITEEILDFLTGIHADRKNIEVRESNIFEKAFYNAYGDMSTHTVSYTEYAKPRYVDDDTSRCNKNREKIKRALMDCVKTELYPIPVLTTQIAFNEWHKKICDFIVNKIGSECVVVDLQDRNKRAYNEPIEKLLCHKDDEIKTVFTYGQAQKLLNMLLKYLYIYYKCENNPSLNSICRFFHTPIDRYVLKAVFKVETYKGLPWSKIQKYQDYTECQKEISNNTDVKKYSSAFVWELTNWPFN